MSLSNIVVLLLFTANEGTKYESVRFRTAFFDTISPIGKLSAFTSLCTQCLTKMLFADTASRAVFPSMPPICHLRHIVPLLTLFGTPATHNTTTPYAPCTLHPSSIQMPKSVAKERQT